MGRRRLSRRPGRRRLGRRRETFLHRPGRFIAVGAFSGCWFFHRTLYQTLVVGVLRRSPSWPLTQIFRLDVAGVNRKERVSAPRFCLAKLGREFADSFLHSCDLCQILVPSINVSHDLLIEGFWSMTI